MHVLCMISKSRFGPSWNVQATKRQDVVAKRKSPNVLANFQSNKRNRNVERSKIGSQEGEAITWGIQLQKASSSPPPEPTTQTILGVLPHRLGIPMESGRPRTRAPAIQLPDCRPVRECSPVVDTSASRYLSDIVVRGRGSKEST